MRRIPPGPAVFLCPPLRPRKAPVLGPLVLALLTASLWGAQDKPEAKTETKPETTQAAAGSQAAAPASKTYVGTETCSTCHEDIFKAFQKNRHAVVEAGKGKFAKWGKQACESCHGPGSVHAESTEAKDIYNPARQPAGTADKGCLSCHLNEQTQAGRIHGGHANSAVTCVSCHSVHGEPKRASLDCTGCHANNWAQFNRPMGHTLGKNAMSCIDCHNPHGGQVIQSRVARSFQAYAANEPGCFKCHSNYRGPFTFEHAPVRQEGCTACHEAHNSVNPRMLNRHEVRFTCLECHANVAVIANPNAGNGSVLGGVPPAFHDLQNPRYRNCTLCHVKVHGSHVNRDLLR